MCPHSMLFVCPREPPSITNTNDYTFGRLVLVCSYPPDLEADWFCGLKTRYGVVIDQQKKTNETLLAAILA